MVSLWMVNASPIILLSKAGLLDVLKHFGCPVVIPEAAAKEIQRSGPSDVSAQALAQASWLAAVDPGAIPPIVAVFGLGDGESAVLSYALANLGNGAILDDRAARNAAATLGILHQGTLALVIQAKMFGLVPAARPILEQCGRTECIYRISS